MFSEIFPSYPPSSMNPPPGQPAHPTQNPLPGIQALFLPNRFQNRHATPGINALPPLPPQMFPAGNPHIPECTFPLPFIYDSNSSRHMHVRCTELSVSSYHTQPKSQTKTASTVMNLTDGRNFPRLKFLHRSSVFLNNLRDYVHMESTTNTFRTNNFEQHLGLQGRILAFPEASKQVRPVAALWGWQQKNLADAPIIKVDSEPGVQTEVIRQLIEPADFLLQTRYDCFRQTSRYPRWGRPTNRAHTVPGRHSAGYSDFILYRDHHGNTSTNAALIEIKTWWSYPIDSCHFFDEAFWNRVTHVWDGWTAKTLESKFLRQIWGELVFFDARFLAAVTGKHVLICCRSGHEELTIAAVGPQSQVTLDWKDTKLLQTIFGMGCAGIDYASLPVNNQVLRQHFIDRIVPPNSKF